MNFIWKLIWSIGLMLMSSAQATDIGQVQECLVRELLEPITRTEPRQLDLTDYELNEHTFIQAEKLIAEYGDDVSLMGNSLASENANLRHNQIILGEVKPERPLRFIFSFENAVLKLFNDKILKTRDGKPNKALATAITNERKIKLYKKLTSDEVVGRMINVSNQANVSETYKDMQLLGYGATMRDWEALAPATRAQIMHDHPGLNPISAFNAEVEIRLDKIFEQDTLDYIQIFKDRNFMPFLKNQGSIGASPGTHFHGSYIFVEEGMNFLTAADINNFSIRSSRRSSMMDSVESGKMPMAKLLHANGAIATAAIKKIVSAFKHNHSKLLSEAKKNLKGEWGQLFSYDSIKKVYVVSDDIVRELKKIKVPDGVSYDVYLIDRIYLLTGLRINSKMAYYLRDYNANLDLLSAKIYNSKKTFIPSTPLNLTARQVDKMPTRISVDITDAGVRNAHYLAQEVLGLYGPGKNPTIADLAEASRLAERRATLELDNYKQKIQQAVTKFAKREKLPFEAWESGDDFMAQWKGNISQAKFNELLQDIKRELSPDQSMGRYRIVAARQSESIEMGEFLEKELKELLRGKVRTDALNEVALTFYHDHTVSGRAGYHLLIENAGKLTAKEREAIIKLWEQLQVQHESGNLVPAETGFIQLDWLLEIPDFPGPILPLQTKDLLVLNGWS